MSTTNVAPQSYSYLPGFYSISRTSLSSSDNLNDIKKPGIYAWYSSIPENAPNQRAYWWMLVISFYSGGGEEYQSSYANAVQIAHCQSNQENSTVRIRYQLENGTWSNWATKSIVS